MKFQPTNEKSTPGVIDVATLPQRLRRRSSSPASTSTAALARTAGALAGGDLREGDGGRHVALQDRP